MSTSLWLQDLRLRLATRAALLSIPVKKMSLPRPRKARRKGSSKKLDSENTSPSSGEREKVKHCLMSNHRKFARSQEHDELRGHNRRTFLGRTFPALLTGTELLRVIAQETIRNSPDGAFTENDMALRYLSGAWWWDRLQCIDAMNKFAAIIEATATSPAPAPPFETSSKIRDIVCSVPKQILDATSFATLCKALESPMERVMREVVNNGEQLGGGIKDTLSVLSLAGAGPKLDPRLNQAMRLIADVYSGAGEALLTTSKTIDSMRVSALGGPSLFESTANIERLGMFARQRAQKVFALCTEEQRRTFQNDVEFQKAGTRLGVLVGAPKPLSEMRSPTLAAFYAKANKAAKTPSTSQATNELRLLLKEQIERTLQAAFKAQSGEPSATTKEPKSTVKKDPTDFKKIVETLDSSVSIASSFAAILGDTQTARDVALLGGAFTNTASAMGSQNPMGTVAGILQIIVATKQIGKPSFEMVTISALNEIQKFLQNLALHLNHRITGIEAQLRYVRERVDDIRREVSGLRDVVETGQQQSARRDHDGYVYQVAQDAAEGNTITGSLLRRAREQLRIRAEDPSKVESRDVLACLRDITGWGVEIALWPAFAGNRNVQDLRNEIDARRSIDAMFGVLPQTAQILGVKLDDVANQANQKPGCSVELPNITQWADAVRTSLELRAAFSEAKFQSVSSYEWLEELRQQGTKVQAIIRTLANRASMIAGCAKLRGSVEKLGQTLAGNAKDLMADYWPASQVLPLGRLPVDLLTLTEVSNVNDFGQFLGLGNGTFYIESDCNLTFFQQIGMPQLLGPASKSIFKVKIDPIHLAQQLGIVELVSAGSESNALYRGRQQRSWDSYDHQTVKVRAHRWISDERAAYWARQFESVRIRINWANRVGGARGGAVSLSRPALDTSPALATRGVIKVFADLVQAYAEDVRQRLGAAIPVGFKQPANRDLAMVVDTEGAALMLLGALVEHRVSYNPFVGFDIFQGKKGIFISSADRAAAIAQATVSFCQKGLLESMMPYMSQECQVTIKDGIASIEKLAATNKESDPDQGIPLTPAKQFMEGGPISWTSFPCQVPIFEATQASLMACLDRDREFLIDLAAEVKPEKTVWLVDSTMRDIDAFSKFLADNR